MLTLYVLRHAKSKWEKPPQRDFDRPLNKRGCRDADDLGQYLAKNDIHPGLVLISPAKRTDETCEHMTSQMPCKPDVVPLKKLYGASLSEICSEIKTHGKSVPHLMVIAHNPGIDDVVWHLTAQDPTNALAIIQSKYATSAMTTFTFDITDWDQLAPRSGTLISYTSPKLRRNAT